jgi:hypothetical protein
VAIPLERGQVVAAIIAKHSSAGRCVRVSGHPSTGITIYNLYLAIDAYSIIFLGTEL